MREHIGFAADIAAVAITLCALLLASYTRSTWSWVLGVIAIATMASMAVLRAYPVPTRVSLEASVAALEKEKLEAEDRFRAAGIKADEHRRERDAAHAKLTTQEAELARASDALRLAKEDLAKAEGVTQRLVDRFVRRRPSEFFELEPIPGRNFIREKEGSYFLVRLKDANTGGRFVFAKGEYELKSDRMHAAATRVVADVLDLIEITGGRYEVFLRGGATQEAWEGPVNAGAEFGPLKYRSLESNSLYGALSEGMPFSPPVTNRHLPLLRAAFVRKLLEQAFSTAELLDKAPADSTNEFERTVDIILYVKP